MFWTTLVHPGRRRLAHTLAHATEPAAAAVGGAAARRGAASAAAEARGREADSASPYGNRLIGLMATLELSYVVVVTDTLMLVGQWLLIGGIAVLVLAKLSGVVMRKDGATEGVGAVGAVLVVLGIGAFLFEAIFATGSSSSSRGSDDSRTTCTDARGTYDC